MYLTECLNLSYQPLSLSFQTHFGLYTPFTTLHNISFNVFWSFSALQSEERLLDQTSWDEKDRLAIKIQFIPEVFIEVFRLRDQDLSSEPLIDLLKHTLKIYILCIMDIRGQPWPGG